MVDLQPCSSPEAVIHWVARPALPGRHDRALPQPRRGLAPAAPAHADGRPRWARTRASPARGARAAARERKDRCCDGAPCPRAARLPAAAASSRGGWTGTSGTPRAVDTARCRNRGTAAARSVRVPRRQSSRAQCGCAPRAAASATAYAGPGSCASAVLASQDCGAGAQAPIEVDHAEAAHEGECRILYLASLGLLRQLAQGFHHAERAAGSACLADRELAAGSVQRERAVPGERMLAGERRSFAFGAERKVLELHERDDRIVVIGLDEIHVRRSGA